MRTGRPLRAPDSFPTRHDGILVRRRARPLATIVAIATALVGCGSSSHGGAAPKTGGEDGGGSNEDTGNGMLPTTGAAGLVSVLQSIDSMNGMPTYNVTYSAAFVPNAASLANPMCTTSTAGPSCQVQICETEADAGPFNPSGTISAGNIAFSGGQEPSTLTPDPDGTYEPAYLSSTMGPIFAANTTLQVAASGAMVPAFQGSLTLGGATLTSPMLSGISAKLPSGDVPVAWSGGTPTDKLQIDVQANAVSDPTMSAAVICVFTGGSGTIPASAMAMLSNLGSLAAGAYASDTVTAGSYDVTMEAWAVSSVGVFTK